MSELEKSIEQIDTFSSLGPIGDADGDLWLQKLRSFYATYTPPPEAMGMTTRYELCFVESYAREWFSGAGRIVDLGCWFGATTAALARGLQANAQTRRNRLVEAVDLFTWEPWMEFHTDRLRLGKSYQRGESFMTDVVDLLSPYHDVVRFEQRDLLRPQPRGGAIEFLFIDAQKSWPLGQSIARSFFPSLVPGTSYVVQQDFAWYHSSILSVHLLMWYLRDHFDFVHQVPWSFSAVFLCTSPIDATIELPSPSYFTLDRIEEAYAWCFQRAEPNRVIYLKVAKALFLLERGYGEEALRSVGELLDEATVLPADLMAGMPSVLERYRREAAAAHDGRRAACVDAIEERLLNSPK